MFFEKKNRLTGNTEKERKNLRLKNDFLFLFKRPNIIISNHLSCIRRDRVITVCVLKVIFLHYPCGQYSSDREKNPRIKHDDVLTISVLTRWE